MQTGKTTVARLYGKFLSSVGVVGSSYIKETSGAKLCTKGSGGTMRMFRRMLGRRDGGTLFVDEAYQLTAPYMEGVGRSILDLILTTMENNIGKLAVVFVGYKDEMESLYEHNPGLSSRIPHCMNFADFSDAELCKILVDNINRQYKGKMKVEDGMDGLYMRIAIRRLSQARGSRGFGNAREVNNLLAKIANRQARRIAKEKREGKRPDPLLFSKEDMIGFEPSLAAAQSPASTELQKLIGLESVKKSVQSMIRMTQLNYHRELNEQKPLQFSLNQLFVGAPGTGKTTVAKLYGRILADIGLLSRGDGMATYLAYLCISVFAVCCPSEATTNSLFPCSRAQDPSRFHRRVSGQVRGQDKKDPRGDCRQGLGYRRGLHARRGRCQ